MLSSMNTQSGISGKVNIGYKYLDLPRTLHHREAGGDHYFSVTLNSFDYVFTNLNALIPFSSAGSGISLGTLQIYTH